MNEFDRIQSEVAEGERWFAGVCDHRSEIDTGRIKRSLAMAAQELWLSRQDTLGLASAASSRIKAGVRAELARSRRQPRRWSRWLLGVSSAAALLTLGVISFQRSDDDRLDDLNGATLVAAFGTLDDLDSDFDAELNALQEAVGSLDGFGSTDAGEDDWIGNWDEASDDNGSGT